MKLRSLLALALLAGLTTTLSAEQKPLRVLVVAGGCCHDYANQKDILKKGIEARLNATVEVAYVDIKAKDFKGKATQPIFEVYKNADWAKNFDVVIHDECAASINDEEVIRGVLKPHIDGIPGLNLHCAMHCYRIGSANEPAEFGTPHGLWFEYLGLQSSGHGPQEPISISHLDKEDALSKNLPDWTTIKEELYNNVKVFDTAKPVTKGKQLVKNKDGTEKEMEFVTAWTNLYKGKTRVFSNTIGHNNDTVSDERYLNFVARGALWATDHLNKDGTPKEGYAK
jgi:hypothetical protein